MLGSSVSRSAFAPTPRLQSASDAWTAGEREAHWAVLGQADAPVEAAAAWLELLCSSLPRATGGVLALGEPDLGPFAPLATWPAGQAPSSLLTEVADEALQAQAPVRVESGNRMALALPLQVQGRLYGLAAVEVDATAAQADLAVTVFEALRWALGSLQALVMGEAAREREAALSQLTATLNLMATVLAEPGFTAAADALATELASRFDCDRVAIGFVRKGSAQVMAVSHSAQFGERMNLIRAIGLAMDEALDQRRTLVLPGPEDGALLLRDHAALSRQHGCDAILTVPFSVNVGRTRPASGAFTFERHLPFGRADIELCQGVVALAARVLESKRREERSAAARLTDGLSEGYRQLLGPKHFGLKLAALLLVSAVVFFSFATGRYTVSADAALEGAIRRASVAPYDGYVETAPRRAGDRVRAGELLASMDTRDLQLEQLRAAALVEQYSRQAQEALAGHDRAQGAISMAQAQQAQAQYDLLADQIRRAAIVAPFDGLVVSGDLSQKLGGAVRRGDVLFEVSPLNSYRVTLEVPEGEIDALRVGQEGRLLLLALPGREWPLTVTRITPVTVAHEGNSFFRVEAALARSGPDLRPGMEGVAKVDAGERRLIWIWTHRLVDWLRVWAWSWL